MSEPTHITMINGFSRGALLDDIRAYPEEIRFSLNRLNGASLWGFSLWRAPEGADLLDEVPFSPNYLQAAGSAEALTIEVRMLDEAGVAHQYVVGRPGSYEGEPSEVISWDAGRHSTRVFADEVFTADEAADIFYAYFLTDEVPDRYVLRELDLG